MVSVLLDVFLTVLCARAGTGIEPDHRRADLAERCGAVPAVRPSPRAPLSFCGPIILVILVGFWATALALGAGLIMHPEFGAGFRASGGTGSTDLMMRVSRRVVIRRTTTPRDHTPSRLRPSSRLTLADRRDQEHFSAASALCSRRSSRASASGWAYHLSSPVGRLDKPLDEALAAPWAVVDMKEDGRAVFPPEE
jgi:hypothetical protein